MISITPAGYRVFTDAVTGTLRAIHLHTENGELTEHGYAPLPLIPSNWDGGTYPDQAWEFEAGPTVDVVGYYVTAEDGSMAFSEMFTKTVTNEKGNTEVIENPMTIKNTGDRIAVSLKLDLLGTP